MSTANTLTSGLDCTSPESIMEPTMRTPAGDQYSLGCVLYFALTGRVPFPEGSAVEKMMAHQTKEPVPVRELAPDVPAGLDEVIKRLMAKTPEQRFTGCDELVEALEPFVGDVNQIPGGAPGNRSGARPGLTQSSGRMAGLPGSKVTLPSKSPPATGERQRVIPPPIPASHAAPAAPAPNVRTPQPNRGASKIPSRASFQLPALPGKPEAGRAAAPAGGSRSALPKASARGTPDKPRPAGGRPAPAKSTAPKSDADDIEVTRWAEEAGPDRKGFGPVGIVAAALLLMVVVYFGATILMK
jgi:serine/threonine-protein kinase